MPVSLCKTIFQLRFKPSLEFYDRLHKAASQLGDYPHWETTGLRVALKDFERRCSLVIGHNVLTYDQDTDDKDVESDRINCALAVLPDALGIKSFTRFGYRRKYIREWKGEYNSLVAVLDVKLFCQDDKFRAFMPEKVEDLTYRVDSADETFGYHWTIGPARKAEIAQLVEFDVQHRLDPNRADVEYAQVLKLYPEVSLFLDVDLYRAEEDISLEQVKELLEDARGKSSQLVGNLETYLFAETLER